MPDTASNLAQKEKIVTAAIALYTDDRAGFTMANIARKTRIKKVEINRLFNSRYAILKYFYVLCVHRYRAMATEIDDFADWSFEEKLSNFAYAMFEMLQEEREFVDEHFVTEIFRPSSVSRFQREVEALFSEFAEGVCGADRLASFLAREYLHLVRFWVADESDDAERTMALVDKASSFVGAALRSGELIESGTDLIRYLIANGVIKAPLAKTFLHQAMRWSR